MVRPRILVHQFPDLDQQTELADHLVSSSDLTDAVFQGLDLMPFAEALATAVEADTDFIEGVQEDLTEVGLYTGPIDGDYGSGTVAAIEKLQEQCDIEVDGRFTVKTHLCLVAELATA